MKTKFEGKYKTGLILAIIGSAIFLALGTISLIVLLATMTVIPTASILALVVLGIEIIPVIIIMVFAVKDLKAKTTNRKMTIGILAIVFASLCLIALIINFATTLSVLGIITNLTVAALWMTGGIMLLVAEKEVSNVDTPQPPVTPTPTEPKQPVELGA
ncbi:hypothetical protein [Williamsoniiplasma lucivorax]|uniref:Uncharacterized protein n=1 Tax=Williamsoniiplasma lucivorax TaxID=209274 RepID=A0A2S5RFC2_9MOLU|nr:hypothetical protein [Williamsoniiplasma lucivorax]PPE06013.1 hypothetical protein ELUCI_v1c03040 [Williamsoniiplasma lucivorax]